MSNITHCKEFEMYPLTFIFIMRTISVISVALNVFCAYCIVFKSTQVAIYKWFLLAYHMQCTLLDFVLTSGSIPVTFLPFVMGYSAGFLYTIFGISHKYLIVLLYTSITLCLVAVVQLFFIRWQLILSSDQRLHMNKTGQMICVAIMYIGFAGPSCYQAIVPSNDPQELADLRKTYTCANLPLEHEAVVYFSWATMESYMWMCCFLIVLGTVITITFIVHSAWLLCSENTNLSAATRKLQSRFLYAQCFQISLPMLVLSIPCIYILQVMINHTFGVQQWTNTALIIMAFHGPISCLSILFMNAPYRQYIWSLLGVPRTSSLPQAAFSNRPVTLTATQH